MNNLQTPKIQAVLSSLLCESNDIACGSNRNGGLNILYRSIKWRLKARDPILDLRRIHSIPTQQIVTSSTVKSFQSCKDEGS